MFVDKYSDIKLVLGDFNVKVVWDIWVTGYCGPGEHNMWERGKVYASDNEYILQAIPKEAV